MKTNDCARMIQDYLETEYNKRISIDTIVCILRLYRESLMSEILNQMEAQIYGIGVIKAVKHRQKKVFGKKVKAHYCLKLKPSMNLRKAVNELYYVDKSK
jgi:hypothetical protein